LGDPLADGFDFGGGQGSAVERHARRAAGDEFEEETLVWLTRDDGGAAGATLEEIGSGGEGEAAGADLVVMAATAAGGDDVHGSRAGVGGGDTGPGEAEGKENETGEWFHWAVPV